MNIKDLTQPILSPALNLSDKDIILRFVLYGSPASMKNQRSFTGSSFVLGKEARSYVTLVEKQIRRLKERHKIFPLDIRTYHWHFDIGYENPLSDASIEILFDIFQHNGLITNDNNIRRYSVDASILDKVTPRTIVTIYQA